MNVSSLIERKLAGQDTGDAEVSIHWDDQDPQNAGPAYRIRHEGREESGSLEHVGWSHDATEGYNGADFFDEEGNYRGPDQHGVYPILK
jgi:hypothetical protein